MSAIPPPAGNQSTSAGVTFAWDDLGQFKHGGTLPANYPPGVRTFWAGRILRPSLYRGFRWPAGCQTPRRPFSSMSRMLSRLVPSIRWSGRTQGGLSQRCITARPDGTGPKWSAHEARCAGVGLVPHPPTRKCPYPNRAVAPVQTQHSPLRSTLAQNRSSTGRGLGPVFMHTYYHEMALYA